MIQDQIMGEADQVRNHLVRMTGENGDSYASATNPNPWIRAYAEQQMQQQAVPPPRPVQPTARTAPIQVKPAPSRPQAQPTSSSMSGAPVNVPFPAQWGAEPWMQARENQPQSEARVTIIATCLV